jgi:hypothetical protein
VAKIKAQSDSDPTAQSGETVAPVIDYPTVEVRYQPNPNSSYSIPFWTVGQTYTISTLEAKRFESQGLVVILGGEQ